MATGTIARESNQMGFERIPVSEPNEESVINPSINHVYNPSINGGQYVIPRGVVLNWITK